MTVAIDNYHHVACNRCPANAGDKGVRVSSSVPMRMVLASPATPALPISILLSARGEIVAGIKAQCDVVAAGCVVKERPLPLAVFSVPVVLLKSAARRWPCCRCLLCC